MNFEKLRASNPEPEYGFSVHWFLEAFNDTFYKSCRDSFRGYFEEHSGIKQWMVFSDYVLHDKAKANDVIAFSIVPYLFEFGDFSDALKRLAPRDMKDTRKVRREFIEFLATGPVLNIGFILNKKRRLVVDERRYYATKFEMMIKQLEVWCSTTPQATSHYAELIGKIEVLREAVARPGANMKLVRDIEIVATLAAYVMFEMSRLVDVEKIGWFSDRDAILSYKAGKLRSPVIFDMVHHLYSLFCQSEGIESKGKLIVGTPEAGADGKVWYDSFNRLPDVIAGTLADYDYKKKRCSREKFIPVVDEVFTSSERNLFFVLELRESEQSATRLKFSWHERSLRE